MSENKNNKTKKSKFSVRKLVYNDKYLILTSIIFAVIVWIGTAMNVSPETTKTITVPVSVLTTTGTQDQLGLKNFSKNTVNVDVTVSAKKYIIRDISAENIEVSVNTSSVVKTGTYVLDIQALKKGSDFTITDYSPKTYTGYFDVEKETSLPVEITYSKNDFVAKGYVLGEPVFNQSNAAVIGASSYVNRVDKIVAEIPIEGTLKESQTFDLIPKAVDIYGNVVDYVSVKMSEDNPTVTIPILKIATLPVSATIVNRPDAIDNNDISIDYSVSQIKLGMLESELKTTDALNIGEIDFNQLNVGKNKFTFFANKLDGITILDKTKKVTITITVPSNFSSKKVSITKNAVNIEGLPEGYTARVNSLSTNYITVIGKDVTTINSKNISGVVSLGYDSKSKVETGTDDYEVHFSIKASDDCWIYGSYTAKISISKN